MFRQIAATLVLFIGTQLGAQTAKNQDSTLAGLKRVLLVVHTSQDSAGTYDAIALELRKAGLRILTSESDPSNDDAMLAVYGTQIRRALGDDAQLRVMVVQRAALARNPGHFIWLPTWEYDDAGRNVIYGAWQQTAVTKATNDFLSHWLDMNGR